MMAHNINGCYKYSVEQKQGTKEHAQYDLFPVKFKAGKENKKLCGLRKIIKAGTSKQLSRDSSLWSSSRRKEAFEGFGVLFWKGVIIWVLSGQWNIHNGIAISPFLSIRVCVYAPCTLRRMYFPCVISVILYHNLKEIKCTTTFYRVSWEILETKLEYEVKDKGRRISSEFKFWFCYLAVWLWTNY